MNLILASASPRRKELLKLACPCFTAISADVEEITPEGMSPEDCPVYLAELKANALLKQFPEALILGCDTSVLLDRHILGKPSDTEDAAKMLRFLSGRVHKVITGCCLIYQGGKRCFSETTDVEFYPLSDLEIYQYIETNEPFDKAGAYGIQGKGALLVKQIQGDYYNVMGLPIAKVSREISALSSVLSSGLDC